jgi:predicted RNase H-like nuclease (RuvC/YqgF family)
MEESLKNRIVIVLAILSLVFFFGTISSCNSSMRQKAGRDKEMAIRLQLEESVNKFSQERLALEEKVKAKEKEAEEVKATLEATKKALVQKQLVNQSLKDDLQKITKLKEALEDDLKRALVKGKNFIK